MKLKTHYHPLAISLAAGKEAAEIRRFAGVRAAHAAKVHCVTLNVDEDDSFIACMRFSIWAHPHDVGRDPSGLPRHESTLVLRV